MASTLSAAVYSYVVEQRPVSQKTPIGRVDMYLICLSVPEITLTACSVLPYTSYPSWKIDKLLWPTISHFLVGAPWITSPSFLILKTHIEKLTLHSYTLLSASDLPRILGCQLVNPHKNVMYEDISLEKLQANRGSRN